MGDSAGGNLAAVVALGDPAGGGVGGADVPPPVAQCLVYPAVDARFDSASMRSPVRWVLPRPARHGVLSGPPTSPTSRNGSRQGLPLLAGDHRGLAPALVVTAGFDPLRDDGANYADALGVRRRGRVPLLDDQVHGFMGMGFLPDSLALATEI